MCLHWPGFAIDFWSDCWPKGWGRSDLPGFLRFAGQREGNRLRTVRDRAERLRSLAHRWFETNASNKGKFDQTPAYIDLLFAFGLARLGETTAARNLLRDAGDAIEQVGTEAHAFLLQAFQYRIEQVLAGKPHAGLLPTEQLEYLDQMRNEEKALPIEETGLRSGSYAVDRLGKESLILQPQEKLDPYRHKKPEQDKLIQELVRLTDVRDRGLLAQRVRRLAEQAAESPRLAETRLRVLIESLALAARVGATLTTDLLAQVGPALDAAATATDPQVVENRASCWSGHCSSRHTTTGRSWCGHLPIGSGISFAADRPHRSRCARRARG